jgi:hypothetical protein
MLGRHALEATAAGAGTFEVIGIEQQAAGRGGAPAARRAR